MNEAASLVSHVASLATILAFVLAARQFLAQAREVRRNTRIAALIHLDSLLGELIAREERIIAGKKAEGHGYLHRAKRVNQVLHPARLRVGTAIFAQACAQANPQDRDAIEAAVRVIEAEFARLRQAGEETEA